MIRVGSTVGNYTVISKLGEGAMASVFLAEHPRIGKRVAIKVIHPELSTSQEMVSRFFTEARAASQIHHDNVVDIQDFGQTPDGDNFIIMEYLDGDTLQSRVKAEGRLDAARAVQIALLLCEGLQAAHQGGVIHRDLKPDNIFLVRRGQNPDFPKILDFGLAKITGTPAQAGANHKTRTGSVLGTPHYMAPEQCEGKTTVDGRADIYSLGCILYLMVTGELPFPGEGFGEVLVKHLREPPPSPRQHNPQVSPALDKVILHCLAKKREWRFQTIADLARALRDPERFSVEIGDDLRRIIGPMPGEPDPGGPSPSAAATAQLETVIGGAVPGSLPPLPGPPPPVLPAGAVAAAPEQRTVIAMAQPAQPQGLSGMETLIAGASPAAPPVAPGVPGGARSGHTVVAEYNPSPHDLPTMAPGTPVPPGLGGHGPGGTIAIGGPGVPMGQSGQMGGQMAGQMGGWQPNRPVGNQTGQMPAPPRAFTRSPAFFGLLGGLGLALVALVLVPLLRPRIYTITITSTPSGAKVLRDGQPIGQTPFVLQLKKGEPEVKLVLHKDGFVDSVRQIAAKEDQTLSVRLLPRPAQPQGEAEGEEGEAGAQAPPEQPAPAKPAKPEATRPAKPEPARPEPAARPEPPKPEPAKPAAPKRPRKPKNNIIVPF